MSFLGRRLKKTAVDFLRGQRLDVAPAELPALINRTANHLLGTSGRVSETAARQAALAAWSELAAAQTRSYVDLAASTPQLLVLVDEVTKTRRLVPVADLVRIVGPRIAAAA